MYTDIVGYSKLTGDNQELALEILAEHNKVLFQCTKHYSGEIIKKTGDGVCALFENSSDSIKCAIDIQKDLFKRNKLNIKERQINIRIGIHYGAVVFEENDVFGDGINLSNKIESIAPAGGIAISEDLNRRVWKENDIYIREYTEIEFNSDKVRIFEIYLDLLDWFKNEKNQLCQKVDVEQFNILSHNYFHNSDYSSAIKFATLSMENLSKEDSYEQLSFICNSFISLGELSLSKILLNQLHNIEHNNKFIDAHINRMDGLLYLNEQKFSKAINSLKSSLKLMEIEDDKYVNEIIFHICNICILKDDYSELKNLLDKINNNEKDYCALLKGIKLLKSGNEVAGIADYIVNIKKIKNPHMLSFGLWYVSLIYFKIKDYKNSQKYILKSQSYLTASSETISDWFQRQKFTDNILIHKEIMNFNEKINIEEDILDFDEFDDDSIIEDEQEGDNEVFNFCPSCGNKNENKFKFCINCGNNLKLS
tara:strand:- start:360 stop:1799 length:1440 start_codon:yes stop_codon:yes gene_type:complete